jgi:opacity protein-like surface antigen
MKRVAFLLLIATGAGGALAAPAAAQSGFALKGHYIFNSTTANDARADRQIPAADAYDLGAELVLPFGIGIGVSGYTANETQADIKTREVSVLGEANYFSHLPFLPVSPYVGVHAGLGVFSGDNATNPGLAIQDKTRSQVGYQIGLRFQPTSLLGVDAQWRRMSTSAAAGQSSSLQRNQVLVGITLF